VDFGIAGRAVELILPIVAAYAIAVVAAKTVVNVIAVVVLVDHTTTTKICHYQHTNDMNEEIRQLAMRRCVRPAREVACLMCWILTTGEVRDRDGKEPW